MPDVALLGLRPAMLVDPLPDRRPLGLPPVHVPVADLAHLGQPDQPVQRHPAAGLGEGVVPPLVEFPDPAVRLGPDVADPVAQLVQQVRAGRVEVRSGPVHGQPYAFEQVSVASPLRLPHGAVAVAGRMGVAVAAQPQFRLAVRRVPAQAVEGMDLRGRGRDAAQHPGQRALDFLGEAELDERVEHERGVADPSVPVVVVAVAADPLRQRAGGRRRHGPGRRVGEKLERQYAAQHQVVVLAAVGNCLAPLPPGLLAGLPPRPYLRGGRHYQRRVVGRDEGEQRVLPRLGGELAAELAQPQLRPAGLLGYQRHHQIPGVQQRHVAHPGPRPDAVKQRPARDPPPHRHLAAVGPDVAGQFGPGERPVRALVERIDHPDLPVPGTERRLQHVGAGQVAPRNLIRHGRLQGEPPAAGRVEDRREHRRRVHRRSRPPVNAAIARDQRDRLAVPDQPVRLDRGELVRPRRALR